MMEKYTTINTGEGTMPIDKEHYSRQIDLRWYLDGDSERLQFCEVIVLKTFPNGESMETQQVTAWQDVPKIVGLRLRKEFK